MDALEAVGDPELREALLFVRSGQRPISVDDLATEQAVHRNVARSRLERLREAGLLTSTFERRSGRSGPGAGRPARVYSPTPETAAIEFPARHYEHVVATLATSTPKRRLREAGISLAKQMLAETRFTPARDLRQAADRMCKAVGRLGFQASVEEVDDHRAVIATPTCPLRPLVVTTPDAAEIDRGMWAGLAAGMLEGTKPASVSCETRDCLDEHASCRVVLDLNAPRS